MNLVAVAVSDSCGQWCCVDKQSMQAMEISQARLSEGEPSSEAEIIIDGAPSVQRSEVQEAISAMDLLLKHKEEGNK